MRLEHTFSNDILKNRTDRMKTRNDTPVTAFSANAAKGVENLLNAISIRVSGYLLPYFVSPAHFWHASRTYFQQRYSKNRTDRMKTRNDTPVTAFSANAAKAVENLLNAISTRVSGYLLPYFVSPDYFLHASRTYFQQIHSKKSHWSHENAQWYASYRIFGKRCERRGEFTQRYINKGIRLSSSLFCFARPFLACI